MSAREVRVSEEPICDFCSQPGPLRMFECPDFPMDQSFQPEYHSKGAWAACATCGDLIDAGNWDKLLLRAVDKLHPKYSFTPRRILTDTVKRSHDLFRAHYKAAK